MGFQHIQKLSWGETISSIVKTFVRSSIQSLRKQTRMLARMSPQGYGMSSMLLKGVELRILSKLPDVVAMLKPLGSYYHQEYQRE